VRSCVGAEEEHHHHRQAVDVRPEVVLL
jgi:hypothetical protein